MRVEVDHDRCEGNAVCVGIAPDLFDLDDDDYAVMKVDEIPADRGRPGRTGHRGMSARSPHPQRLEAFIR